MKELHSSYHRIRRTSHFNGTGDEKKTSELTETKGGSSSQNAVA